MEILPFGGLRNRNSSLEFEGCDHSGAGVSFFLVDAAPGKGPSLHKQDHADSSSSRGAPPSGRAEAARHPREPALVTEWLEEEAYG